ncbi:MAG: amino acid permease [Labilithrix sp.]|nr:amino acid permease [Labilithrix sp.]MCW5814433.1 amino acid permease [Labilithrix sp.]
MGGFSSFAVSFSIISVLTGCIVAYKDAFAVGGPGSFGIGWPLVAAGTMLVALAMAELASAFPTAGALYHWSALLGGAGAGWVTAAINVTGQLAIVAAIDLGCAAELAPVLGVPEATLPLLGVVLASHLVVNAFSVRLVALLNDFSATVHILGVVVIVGALFLFARAQPVSFFFATNLAVGPLGFWNGLVLSMFTFTGYDASAHLAEETHDPARRTPWGILASVGVSAVFGWLLLAAITLAIDPNDPSPLAAMTTGLGSAAGRAAMSLAVAAMWFCGLSSVTSASRTVYAFARDGGLPGSRVLARVNPRTRTPIVAIVAVTLLPFLLVLGTHVASSAGLLDVMTKMATMGLYVSYAIPIALGAVARSRHKWRRPGPFHLRGFGIPVAWAATAWCAFVLVVCSLPPNLVAAEMLACVLVVLAVIWFGFVRRRFVGPKVDLASLEERRS